MVRLISSARITLAKNGPGLKTNSPLRGVVDARAEDVRGQQVGRELDPPERTVDAGRQGPGQEGLADARHVLDQTWPSASRATTASLMTSGLPRTTSPTFSSSRFDRVSSSS